MKKFFVSFCIMFGLFVVNSQVIGRNNVDVINGTLEHYEFSEDDIIFKGFVYAYNYDEIREKHYGTDKILNKDGNDKCETYVFIYKRNEKVKVEIATTSIAWRTISVWDSFYILENTEIYTGKMREFTTSGEYYNKGMIVEFDKSGDNVNIKIAGNDGGLLDMKIIVIFDNDKLLKL